MSSSALSAPCWRHQAARIVEELFPATGPGAWDILLDLRTALLEGTSWEGALDQFLRCRVALEADHYLPFFRLRRLIACSLQLEATLENNEVRRENLASLLQRRHATLESLKQAVSRELFEQDLRQGHAVPLRVVEAV